MYVTTGKLVELEVQTDYNELAPIPPDSHKEVKDNWELISHSVALVRMGGAYNSSNPHIMYFSWTWEIKE